MPRFSLRIFLIIFAAISVVLALLRDETFMIASATTGFLAGTWFAAELLKLSLVNLRDVVAQSWRERSYLPWVGRIRWLFVDGTILVLLFALISIANYILMESTGGGAWLVTIGSVTIPLVVLLIDRRLHKADDSTESIEQR